MEPIKIILCEKCEKAYPMFPSCIDDNDIAARERCLKEHSAETFSPIKESFVTKRPNLEIYFLATNQSGERFVGCKYRDSVQDPFLYRFFRGVLKVKITDLKLQKQVFRQTLEERALSEGIVLGKEKIDFMIACLENQIKYDRYDDMALADVSELSEWQKDGYNVTVLLNQRLKNYIKNRCADFFTKKEIGFLEKFIAEENVEDGVLACLGRCKVDPEYR